MLLFVGDLHLTDQTRDEYRFRIFDWLAKKQQELSIEATFLAGDLTDSKDRHSATLVNKTVGGLMKLKPPIYIDRGNHDYRDPENPFFKFLNHMDGVRFAIKPMLTLHAFKVGIIPHYREQAEFDRAINTVKTADLFLVHQTFDGAIAESGVVLSGLSASLVESLKPRLGVLAGDVHRPQRQGLVTYVGCPYHVRFGDGFTPRCLLINPEGKRKNLYFDAPYKWSITVRDAGDILNHHNNLMDGDQVKLTIEVPREEAVDWQTIKAGILDACKEIGVEVYGCKLEIRTSKPKERKIIKAQGEIDVFDQFCKAENLASKIRSAGRHIITTFQNNKLES